MTARTQAAQEFVLLWQYLKDAIGAARALADPSLQAARRAYLLALETPPMSEPLIMPVKPGALSELDIAKLEAAGIVVIRVDDPSSIRLICPTAEVDSSTMLRCAIKALTYRPQYSTGDTDNMRAKFVESLAEAMKQETTP